MAERRRRAAPLPVPSRGSGQSGDRRQSRPRQRKRRRSTRRQNPPAAFAGVRLAGNADSLFQDVGGRRRLLLGRGDIALRLAGGDSELGERFRRRRLDLGFGWGSGAGALLLDQVRRDRRLVRTLAGEYGRKQDDKKDES